MNNNEPNHELTDSEAQAFQAEPHVLHLIKAASRRPQRLADDRPAGLEGPERPEEARPDAQD